MRKVHTSYLHGLIVFKLLNLQDYNLQPTRRLIVGKSDEQTVAVSVINNLLRIGLNKVLEVIEGEKVLWTHNLLRTTNY